MNIEHVPTNHNNPCQTSVGVDFDDNGNITYYQYCNRPACALLGKWSGRQEYICREHLKEFALSTLLLLQREGLII